MVFFRISNKHPGIVPRELQPEPLPYHPAGVRKFYSIGHQSIDAIPKLPGMIRHEGLDLIRRWTWNKRSGSSVPSGRMNPK
jgi:hypothetical protein